jgi:branched-chain amino acid transport system ATP-binding protein
MTEALLRVEALRAGYGDAIVIDDIHFALGEGDALAVLGRNGMGKTTLILTLMGLTRLFGGAISLRGKRLERLPTNRRAALGLGWAPQERNIFASLSLEENLTVAARPGHWTVARVFELFPSLAERRRNFGNQLSGGEQQMLAIARALMTNPPLLLLDEPLEGLAPIIVEELTRTIRRLAAEGMGMILVEQHTQLALGLTRQAIILERGRIVFQGTSDSLSADPAILARYVGLRGERGNEASRGIARRPSIARETSP